MANIPLWFGLIFVIFYSSMRFLRHQQIVLSRFWCVKINILHEKKVWEGSWIVYVSLMVFLYYFLILGSREKEKYIWEVKLFNPKPTGRFSSQHSLRAAGYNFFQIYYFLSILGVRRTTLKIFRHFIRKLASLIDPHPVGIGLNRPAVSMDHYVRIFMIP